MKCWVCVALRPDQPAGADYDILSSLLHDMYYILGISLERTI